MDGKSKVTDGFFACAIQDQNDKDLGLAVRGNDALYSLDVIFEVMDLKIEFVLQAVIHIDDAVIGIFAECFAIFFYDQSIFSHGTDKVL